MFWGTLFVVLDFTFNGFDILMDWLGWLMIIGGLDRVRASDRKAGGNDAISLCQLVALVALIGSVVPNLEMSRLAEFSLGAAEIVATGVFCGVLGRRMTAVGWSLLATRWLHARTWVWCCWALPWVVAWLLGLYVGEWHTNNPLIGLPVFALSLAPLLVILVTIYRTELQARRA